jgi:hypothetical protein
MSREPKEFAVLAFASTHDALAAEALLGQMGVDAVPIPTPKVVSAGCGIALRLPVVDEDRALEYLERAGTRVAKRARIEDV